ncbi:MAG: hypothetical protein DRJ65_18890 [Acidobacteria bacterium]|nr:MAG: hypothetical protein DRJ65_18890 [Acidobacteriota bacterium]
MVSTLMIVASVPAEAVKILLDKPMLFSEEGDFVGHQSIEREVLDSMRFVTIAAYSTFLAGEVQEEDLVDFYTAAEENAVNYEIRRDYDLIQVNGYSFSSFGEGPDLPDGLAIAGYDGDVGLYLIQFKAPVTADWIEELRTASNILSFIPQNTFIVRSSPAMIQRCREMVGVQHVSLFHPAYKIQRALLTIDEPVDVIVHLDGDQDMADLQDFLGNLTSQQVDIRGEPDSRSARLDMTRGHLVEVAARSEVLWIEPILTPAWSGERQAMVTAGLHDGTRPDDPELGATHEGYHQWLLDKGFCTPTEAPAGCYPYWTKVGLFDSGLNTMKCPAGAYNPQTGVCSNWDSGNVSHPDLEHNSNLSSACAGQGGDCDGPILQRFFCVNHRSGLNQCLDDSEYVFSDLAFDGDGHGTATGSILSGIPSTTPPEQDQATYFRGTGLAPSTQIIVAKVGKLYRGENNEENGMSENEYRDLMTLVEGTWARFASNSWNYKPENWWWNPENPVPAGTLPYTAYSGFSRMIDELVRDASGDSILDPMTIVFSSGNFGAGWVAAPANAKNAIVVGTTQGWSTTGTDGAAHPDCDSLNQVIGNIVGNVGWQSNRMYIGEDDSGTELPRFKPDLVAPGTQIAAARAQQSGTPDLYQCFWGTSAAAPAVTAAAILADAWYYYVISNPQAVPSPAMVKAMLIAHADDLYGGTDHFTNTTMPHSPSPAQGWGRVNLDKLFQTTTGVTVFDEDHLTSPNRRFTVVGQAWTTTLQVDDPTQPIIAVMVCTDASSNPTATGGLMVNDLRLRITKPGGIGTQKHYFGNTFDTNSWYSTQFGNWSWIVTGDQRNTVEVIRIPPQSLTVPFTLTVSAKAINAIAVPGLDNNNFNQDFALYVFNAAPSP